MKHSYTVITMQLDVKTPEKVLNDTWMVNKKFLIHIIRNLDISPDFILSVTIDRHPVCFYVHKRPHVDFFLSVVSIDDDTQ